MAEALAVGASIIAVVQISDRIINLCRFYIDAARDTPSDIRNILLEISTLRAVFNNLSFLKDRNDDASSAINTLSGKDGTIETCRRTLEQLEGLFPAAYKQTSNDQNQLPSMTQKFNTTLTTLAWPLKEKKAQRLTTEIARCKDTIVLALSAESAKDIKDVKTSTQKMQIMLSDDKREKVYKWLKRTDPSTRHNIAEQSFELGTCEWLTRTPEWLQWQNGSNRGLWIHGIPGAGKTVLAYYATQEIKKQLGNTTDKIVASIYYYCYYGNNQNEAAPFLRWLVVELCRKIDFVPVEVYDLYKCDHEPSIEDLLRALVHVLDKYDSAVVIIDALDESFPRNDLLKILRDILLDPRFSNIKIFATSRDYLDIKAAMEEICQPLSMNNPWVEQDVRTHIRSELRSDWNFRKWPEDLLIEAEEAITVGAKGMFRWAVCQIDAIKRLKIDRDVIKRALASLPKTLKETYDRVFDLIPIEDQHAVKHLLTWMCLRTELDGNSAMSCSVLVEAVSRSMEVLEPLQTDRYYDLDTFKELCGCLVKGTEFYLSFSADEEGEVMEFEATSFAHYTVKEYLGSFGDQDVPNILLKSDDTFKLRLLETVFLEALTQDLSLLYLVPQEFNSCYKASKTSSRDFIYLCVAFVLKAIELWPDKLSQDEQLCSLAIDLFNPSKRNVPKLLEVVRHSESSDNPAIPKIYKGPRFLLERIDWDMDVSNIDAIHLFYLLTLGENNLESHVFARRFILLQDDQTFLSRRLKYHDGKYIYDGTIIEIFAQRPVRGLKTFRCLLDWTTTLCEPSKLLTLFMDNHILEEKCGDGCLVTRLLEFGADPNSEEYRITALQIATVCIDYKGVKRLLEAGADPNNTGNTSGASWGAKSALCPCEHLFGLSPLHIIGNVLRNGSGKLGGYTVDELKANGKLIEAILLQYGGKDFRIRDDHTSSFSSSPSTEWEERERDVEILYEDSDIADQAGSKLNNVCEDSKSTNIAQGHDFLF